MGQEATANYEHEIFELNGNPRCDALDEDRSPLTLGGPRMQKAMSCITQLKGALTCESNALKVMF